MAYIPVLARVANDATALVISVVGDTFSLSTTRGIWFDSVPVKATCSGTGVALLFEDTTTASIVTTVVAYDDAVPVIGISNGTATEILINATTGVITAGTASTTLEELFGGGSSLILWLPAFDGILFQSSAGTTPAVANNDPIGYWSDSSEFGNNFIQATAGKRPLLQTAIPSALFDGTDDILSGAPIENVVGTVTLTFVTGATAFATRGAQVLLGSANAGNTNNWFEIGITSDGQIYIESNVSGTKHTSVGSTYLAVSTAYILTVIYDGVDYYAQVNSTEQNPLAITNAGPFAWFGDIASATNLTLGGTITSAGAVRPFQGQILEARIYSEDITA